MKTTGFRRRVCLVAAVFLLWTAGAAAAETGLRKWTATTGQSVMAKFVDYSEADAKVVLEKQDGTRASLPLSQLSLADRRWVEAELKRRQEAVFEEQRAKLEFPDKTPPKRLRLDGVPMVKQKSNYCVPASASMIAAYHRMRVDQTQIAKLSSAASLNSEGTYPADMAKAMSALGFDYDYRSWGLDKRGKASEDQMKEVFEFLRACLAAHGPMYVSFRPGVFGDMGHGCVLTGYDDGAKKLYFNNPWGVTFELDYREFGVQVGTVMGFRLPPLPAGDARALADRAMGAVPTLPVSVTMIAEALQKSGLKASLKLTTRGDREDDRNETRRWGLSQGQRFLQANLQRSLLIVVPVCGDKGELVEVLCVYRDPGAANPQLLARRLTKTGWQAEESVWISAILPTWPTLMAKFPRPSWDLPMVMIGE